MNSPMWRDAAPDLDDADQEGCRPVILAFGNATVRETGQFDSVPVVTVSTKSAERADMFANTAMWPNPGSWVKRVRAAIKHAHTPLGGCRDLLARNDEQVY